jgi:hypothetical protein
MPNQSSARWLVKTPRWKLWRTLAQETNVQEVFYRHLVAVVKYHGVKRVVNLSAWELNNDRPFTSSRFFKCFFRPVFLRHVLADK